MNTPDLVPELDVTNLKESLSFYVDRLGFTVQYDRPEEAFSYLALGNVHIMLEEAAGPGRRFRTAPLEKPFGRGVNFQIRVENAKDLWNRVSSLQRQIVIPLEERWYQTAEGEVGHQQFVIADPDGYLLRCFSSLGKR